MKIGSVQVKPQVGTRKATWLSPLLREGNRGCQRQGPNPLREWPRSLPFVGGHLLPLPLLPPRALELVIRGTDLGLFEERAAAVKDTACKVAILLFL